MVDLASLFLALPARNDYPDRAAAFAVAAAFILHEFSGAAAFQTVGDDVQLLERSFGEFGGVFKEFGVMVLAKPEDEFAFEVFAIFDLELGGAVWPPFVDAAVTDGSTGIEKGPGLGTAEEFLTPGAGHHAQQGEGLPEPIEFKGVAGQDLFWAGIGFVGHGIRANLLRILQSGAS